MKLDQMYDEEVLEQSKIFGLQPDMVKKLRKVVDKEKLVYEWVKTDYVNLATFKKLLVYLIEHES